MEESLTSIENERKIEKEESEKKLQAIDKENKIIISNNLKEIENLQINSKYLQGKHSKYLENFTEFKENIIIRLKDILYNLNIDYRNLTEKVTQQLHAQKNINKILAEGFQTQINEYLTKNKANTEKLQSKIEYLNSFCENLKKTQKQELDKLQDEKNKLLKEFQEKSDKINIYVEDQKKFSKEKNQLISETTHKNQEIEKMSLEISQLQISKENLTKEFGLGKNQLILENNQKNLEITKLSEELLNIKEKIIVQEKATEKLKKNLALKDDEISKKNIEIKNITEKKVLADGEILGKIDEIKVFMEKNEKLSTIIKNQDKKINSKDNEIINLEIEIENYKKELIQLKKENEKNSILIEGFKNIPINLEKNNEKDHINQENELFELNENQWGIDDEVMLLDIDKNVNLQENQHDEQKISLEKILLSPNQSPLKSSINDKNDKSLNISNNKSMKSDKQSIRNEDTTEKGVSAQKNSKDLLVNQQIFPKNENQTMYPGNSDKKSKSVSPIKQRNDQIPIKLLNNFEEKQISLKNEEHDNNEVKVKEEEKNESIQLMINNHSDSSVKKSSHNEKLSSPLKISPHNSETLKKSSPKKKLEKSFDSKEKADKYDDMLIQAIINKNNNSEHQPNFEENILTENIENLSPIQNLRHINSEKQDSYHHNPPHSKSKNSSKIEESSPLKPDNEIPKYNDDIIFQDKENLEENKDIQNKEENLILTPNRQNNFYEDRENKIGLEANENEEEVLIQSPDKENIEINENKNEIFNQNVDIKNLEFEQNNNQNNFEKKNIEENNENKQNVQIQSESEKNIENEYNETNLLVNENFEKNEEIPYYNENCLMRDEHDLLPSSLVVEPKSTNKPTISSPEKPSEFIKNFDKSEISPEKSEKSQISSPLEKQKNFTKGLSSLKKDDFDYSEIKETNQNVSDFFEKPDNFEKVKENEKDGEINFPKENFIQDEDFFKNEEILLIKQENKLFEDENLKKEEHFIHNDEHLLEGENINQETINLNENENNNFKLENKEKSTEQQMIKHENLVDEKNKGNPIVNENLIKEDENFFKENDNLIIKDENIIKQIENFIQQEENLIKEDENLTNEENLIINDENLKNKDIRKKSEKINFDEKHLLEKFDLNSNQNIIKEEDEENLWGIEDIISDLKFPIKPEIKINDEPLDNSIEPNENKRFELNIVKTMEFSNDFSINSGEGGINFQTPKNMDTPSMKNLNKKEEEIVFDELRFGKCETSKIMNSMEKSEIRSSKDSCTDLHNKKNSEYTPVLTKISSMENKSQNLSLPPSFLTKKNLKASQNLIINKDLLNSNKNFKSVSISNVGNIKNIFPFEGEKKQTNDINLEDLLGNAMEKKK